MKSTSNLATAPTTEEVKVTRSLKKERSLSVNSYLQVQQPDTPSPSHKVMPN